MILAEGKRANPTKSLFEIDIVFSLILGAFRGPAGEPKCEFARKSNFHMFLYFKLPLGHEKIWILGGFWVSSWGPKTDMLAPRRQDVRSRKKKKGHPKKHKNQDERKIRRTPSDPRSLSAQGPLGGLHDRPLEDLN